jgi:hypothetical protein
MLGDPGAGNAGGTLVVGTRVARTADNPQGQSIRVVLREASFDGSDSAATPIVHEGSHAADGARWVASGFAPGMNPGAYGTEVGAYQAGTSITIKTISFF